MQEPNTGLVNKYHALRESFMKLQRHCADLEVAVGKMRHTLHEIQHDTTDGWAEGEAARVLRENPDAEEE